MCVCVWGGLERGESTVDDCRVTFLTTLGGSVHLKLVVGVSGETAGREKKVDDDERLHVTFSATVNRLINTVTCHKLLLVEDWNSLSDVSDPPCGVQSSHSLGLPAKQGCNQMLVCT